ncbi:MAG: Crp/Fnr family transcriptional regulator [Opitutales bacterium]
MKNIFPLLAGRWLDLPPKITRILLTAGAAGIILVVAGSLVGKQAGTIGIDKVIHCSAYALLGTALVLGLPAKRAIAGLIGLALLSYLIELLQPLNARSRDFSDAYANTAGVCIGGGLGLIMRMAFAWLWTELHQARIRKTLARYKPGEVILEEGQRIERFHVVRSGRVSITREEEGEQVEVDVAGPGEPFGLIAEVLEKSQPNTVTAIEPTEVYQLDYDAIEDAIGGHDQPAAKIMRSLARELDSAQEHLAEKGEDEESEEANDSPLA